MPDLVGESCDGVTDAAEVFALSGDETELEDEDAEPKQDGSTAGTASTAPMTRVLTAAQNTLVRKAHINLGSVRGENGIGSRSRRC